MPRQFSTNVTRPPPSVFVYELQLKELFEKYTTSPCRERIQECFQILEEIIPSLGPLGSVVAVIKDEMYRSVYSKDLTSKEKEPFLERVPYFKAINRLNKAR